MIFAAAAWTVTAYAIGCDVAAGARTKAGTRPVAEHTIAADPAVLPIGSVVTIDGLPGRRQVHDVGGLVRGRHIDVFMSNCAEARAFGRQRRAVNVLHVPQSSRVIRTEAGARGPKDREAKVGRVAPAIHQGFTPSPSRTGPLAPASVVVARRSGAAALFGWCALGLAITALFEALVLRRLLEDEAAAFREWMREAWDRALRQVRP